jgi:2-aminoadipate transaminase
MSRSPTKPRWEELFARRTKANAADGLASILALANATDLISFAGGFPDPSTFPGREIQEHFSRLVADEDASALQYAPVAGLPGPRLFLADRLERLEDRRPAEEGLILTSGAIEALELLGKSLIDPGDVVLVEGPTYLGAIMAFQSFEAAVQSVPIDAGGLDVGRLEEAVRAYGPPKLLYVIPDHQNPAGITLAYERREQLVEVARRHGFLIVEDVAYRELGFSEQRLPSLWSLAPDVVLQAGTFSKTFMPGVRLGWGVGPPEIVSSMVWAKQNTDQCAGALGQRLLEEYGRSGGLEDQARRARTLYGRRCALLLRALEAHMPAEVSWTKPAGGFFSWLDLPEHIDGTAVARRAADHGVAVVPGAPFFPGEGGENNLRLSFSRVDDVLIDEGIKRLASVIDDGSTEGVVE